VYPQQLADDTQLGRAADTPEGHAVIQREQDRLEKWAGRHPTGPTI